MNTGIGQIGLQTAANKNFYMNITQIDNGFLMRMQDKEIYMETLGDVQKFITPEALAHVFAATD